MKILYIRNTKINVIIFYISDLSTSDEKPIHIHNGVPRDHKSVLVSFSMVTRGTWTPYESFISIKFIIKNKSLNPGKINHLKRSYRGFAGISCMNMLR